MTPSATRAEGSAFLNPLDDKPRRVADTFEQHRETQQIIEKLVAMPRDYRDGIRQAQALKLSDEEIAFYHALAENPEVLREMKRALKRVLEQAEKLADEWSV